MIASLVTKAILSQTISIFNSKQISFNEPVYELSSFNFTETSIMIIFALTELGYIFFWTLSQKPYELYSVLNMEKCKKYYNCVINFK